jgi:hypothetical protein
MEPGVGSSTFDAPGLLAVTTVTFHCHILTHYDASAVGGLISVGGREDQTGFERIA